MKKPTRYYKVLNADGTTNCGAAGFKWDMPRWIGPKHNGHWNPGKWMPVENDPVLCRRGYHACTRNQLLDFLIYGDTICVIELRGTIVAGNDKVVASEARLTEILPWGEDAARFFAVECAADVIHLMKDERSIVALETAFRFACDDATQDELGAARDAAWDAARDAARGAAWGAAWGAARGAAWGAARDAARGAAWGAARGAAWGAAWGAARGAAWGAAGTAAWDAAWDAARAKQTDRLMFWLGEE